VRLLADHYAQEANVTVYGPDFFGNDPLLFEPILNGRWHEFDLLGYVKKNSREVREPEIFECASSTCEVQEGRCCRLLLWGLGSLAPGCKGALAATRELHLHGSP
jgi:hypothetical protein